MTLPSAIRAELYRTVRNRHPLFWAFFAVPLLFLLLAILREVQLAGAPTEPSLAHVVIRSLRTAGNPMVHLFYAVGAATLFAGEYHWQTWRVLVPRNSRPNIVCAKFATYGFFLSLSLIACLVGPDATRGHTGPSRPFEVGTQPGRRGTAWRGLYR